MKNPAIKKNWQAAKRLAKREGIPILEARNRLAKTPSVSRKMPGPDDFDRIEKVIESAQDFINLCGDSERAIKVLQKF